MTTVTKDDELWVKSLDTQWNYLVKVNGQYRQCYPAVCGIPTPGKGPEVKLCWAEWGTGAIWCLEGQSEEVTVLI